MADYSELLNQLKAIMKVDRRLRSAASTTHQLMAQRIFWTGTAADGGPIGTYSTKPGYFSPERSPKKFTGLGKAGKSKFKNGKVHKTRYFEDGYAGFRSKAGRQNSRVDLRLTGTLEGSFVVGSDGKSGYASGFVNDEQAAIAEGNESRFDTIVFELTADEEETFAELMIPE